MYIVLAENDESKWKDETGAVYHFPKRYKDLIVTGNRIVFYKGRLKNSHFLKKRLSSHPHYFAVGEVGKIFSDSSSSKGDLFALIENFQPFLSPVLSKLNDAYIETIPTNRISNYWRDGVRKISESIFQTICNRATIAPEELLPIADENSNDVNQSLESFSEGASTRHYTTKYERNPKLRKQALAIHGYSCKACDFNFKNFYGDFGENFIHVHHIHPVSAGERQVDPEFDLLPLCANCHAIVHRRKDMVLTLPQLIAMIHRQSETK